MAKKVYQATFSNGETIKRSSDHDYITAYVVVIKGLRLVKESSWDTAGKHHVAVWEVDFTAAPRYGATGFSGKQDPNPSLMLAPSKWDSKELLQLKALLRAHTTVEVVKVVRIK